MNQSKIEEIISKLLANAAGLKYGNAGVSLKLHDGRVVEVAYTTAEQTKEKIEKKEKET